MANLDRAKRKIHRVIMRWYSDDPIMLRAWCLVHHVPSKTQETMGIDSRCVPPKIRYNPNFVNALTIEQLETVMASEGFKLLLRHPTTRLKTPKEICNIASSVSVNEIMNYFPGEDYALNTGMFNLESGKYMEFYFRKLKEMADDVQQKVSQVFNQMSDEEKQQLIDDAMKEAEAQAEAEANGEGKDADGYPSMDGKNPLKEYNDPNGNSNKDWGENIEVDAAVKNFIQKNKSEFGYGKHTGKASQFIIAANKPKISWKEIIRRFHTSVVKGATVSTRKKVNRRYDLTYPGARRQYESEIIMAIDVSGSMSDEDIEEGFAVVNSICKHSKLHYILFDTEIKRVEKNYKIVRKEININGRGGTNFDAIIEYADKNKCDGLIIFSDMMAPAPPKPRNTKVLWLSHSKGQKPPVDWGMTAELNRYE